MKINKYEFGHMTKMAAMLVYGKMLTFSNIFSSETTRPIEGKSNVKNPRDGGMEVYSLGTGHMTKMATMPILISKMAATVAILKFFKQHLLLNPKSD